MQGRRTSRVRWIAAGALTLAIAIKAHAQATATPGSASDSDVPTVPLKKPSEICAVDDSSHALIDRLHDNLFKLTCSSVTWFDGLFGNRRYEQEYRGTNGSLTMGSLWSQRDSFDKVLRFKLHVYLPQL